LSGRLVPLSSQKLKITLSIGGVKLIIPVETSQTSMRSRARKGNGQFAREHYDVKPPYEMGGYDRGA
jgi:hypothetical protein